MPFGRDLGRIVVVLREINPSVTTWSVDGEGRLRFDGRSLCERVGANVPGTSSSGFKFSKYRLPNLVEIIIIILVSFHLE